MNDTDRNVRNSTRTHSKWKITSPQIVENVVNLQILATKIVDFIKAYF